MLYPNGTATRPEVSSPFGPRDPSIGISTLHAGADLIGFTTVHAITAGKVTRAGWLNAAAGNTVTIDHGAGVTSIYMHLEAFHVRAGDRVGEGTRLAVMGSTGNATGRCVHLEVRVHGKSIEPLGYIAARLTQPTTTGDDDMLQNIKGKAGTRSGGLWLLAGGKATFLGHDPRSKLPYLTDEAQIRELAKHYEGMPV